MCKESTELIITKPESNDSGKVLMKDLTEVYGRGISVSIKSLTNSVN